MSTKLSGREKMSVINYLHSYWHRVEANNYDPVTREHAEWYNERAEVDFNPAVLDHIEARIGGFAGKRVLDLGGGPGQWTVAMAQRGSHVTWHDISKTYQRMVQARAWNCGVKITFSLGYLEEAARLSAEPYDLVFCKGCWCYGRGDRTFGRLLFSLIKPGGCGYIECMNALFAPPTGGARKLQQALYDLLRWKVGHPYPRRGRIAAVMHSCGASRMELQYAEPKMDAIIFQKPLD
jgi:2-polyprenyl-3-methyl-5-hydroxy-6-metoxy-1,4-benzoquinol methylase